MTIAYISDLHLDFHLGLNASDAAIHRFIQTHLKPPAADVLCIAGDTGHYNTQDIRVLVALKSYYPRILVVGGNHNLYLLSKAQKSQYEYNSFNRLSEFYSMCTDNGVTVIDGSVVIIDGVTFAGAMLWYQVKDYLTWSNYYSDSINILEGYPIRAMYSNSTTPTFNPSKFYQSELLKIQPCDIFVSHVSPISIPALTWENEFDQFYYADCLDLIKQSSIKHCIFGHYHGKHTQVIDNISFHIAAYGYPSESNTPIQTFVYKGTQ